MQTLTSILTGHKPIAAREDLGGRGLSDNQLDLLCWIAGQHLKSGLSEIPWTHAGEWTASDRASESRTLRRLEDRGLVERLNMNGDYGRTTHVAITEAGLRIIKAKGLTDSVLTVAGIVPSGDEIDSEHTNQAGVEP